MSTSYKEFSEKVEKANTENRILHFQTRQQFDTTRIINSVFPQNQLVVNTEHVDAVELCAADIFDYLPITDALIVYDSNFIRPAALERLYTIITQRKVQHLGIPAMTREIEYVNFPADVLTIIVDYGHGKLAQKMQSNNVNMTTLN